MCLVYGLRCILRMATLGRQKRADVMACEDAQDTGVYAFVGFRIDFAHANVSPGNQHILVFHLMGLAAHPANGHCL